MEDYKMNRKTPFVKEFKDVAFSLQQGEISEPLKLILVFIHIYVEKSKDKKLNYVILLTPSVSEEAQTCREKISLIRNKIIAKEITLLKLPEQNQTKKETRANGGSLLIQNTGYLF
jgi:peptidyl-prolyl cis-trans isomerase SurA